MSSLDRDAKVIFFECLNKETPESVDAFLSEACEHDSKLRRRVESLLRSHQDADSFLGGRPRLGKTVDLPSDFERVGANIGPYKLLQQIGEGGMGVVYMAEQTDPVKRRVALKIIKPGLDTRQTIARFEAERQALALMDHPNIAKVLDAGTTAGGRPYFAMELVNGLPLTQFCDDHNLTVDERLRLFVSVCKAVQHAHRRGIIHRDLKPSNILVAEYDHEVVPKVIDFGVAKATGQTLTDKTMFTELGQVMGTLEYMSPEQSKRNQLDVDTRTDVYSLGVVLYEVLTGETPMDRVKVKNAAIDELIRMIREDEPPRPSQRISTSATLPSVAARRGVDPARLGFLLKGELDWIVMKSLEKERKRRYESVSQFSDDINHYLNDLPVLACPPSANYRFRKFARHNRLALASAAAVLFALLMGLGGTSATALALFNSNRELKQSRNEANLATGAEREERIRAGRGEYRYGVNFAFEAINEGNRARMTEVVTELSRKITEEIETGIEWDFLQSQLARYQQLDTLPITGACTSLAFTPDAKFLVVCAEELHAIDLVRGRVTAKSGEFFRTNVVVANNKLLISKRGDERWTSHSLDVATLQPTEDQPLVNDGMMLPWFSPRGDLIARLTDDSRIGIVRVSTGQPLWRTDKSVPDHFGYRFAFSADQSLLATGGRDGIIRLFDVQTGRQESKCKTTGWVESITFSNHTHSLVASGKDVVLLWKIDHQRDLSSPDQIEVKDVCSVAFSQDDSLIAFAARDRKVRLVDVESTSILSELQVPSHVESLAFHPGGDELAVGTRRDGVHIFNRQDWLHELSSHSVAQHHPAIDVSNHGLVVRAQATENGFMISTWDPKTDQHSEVVSVPFTENGGGAPGLAFSPDGKVIAIGCSNGRLILHNTISGKSKSRVVHDGFLTEVAYSPDGRYVASVGWQPTIHVYDTQTDQSVELDSLIEGRGAQSVAFSSQGLLAAGGGRWGSHENPGTGALKVWKLADGKLKTIHASTHNEMVRCIDFSPSGRRIVASHDFYSSEFKIFDLDHPGKEVSFRGHGSIAMPCCFSAEGNRVITGGDDGSIRFWDAKNGTPIGKLDVGQQIRALELLPDREGFVSASIQGSTRAFLFNQPLK